MKITTILKGLVLATLFLASPGIGAAQTDDPRPAGCENPGDPGCEINCDDILQIEEDYVPMVFTKASGPVHSYTLDIRKVCEDALSVTVAAKDAAGGTGPWSLSSRAVQFLPEPDTTLGLLAGCGLLFTLNRRRNRKQKETCI